MNKDQLKGRMDAAAGKAKRAVGRLAQDSSLEQKGRLQELAGSAQARYGDTKEQWKKERRERE